ncbi:MAG: hypothetical protein WD600_10540 [Pseudohongiella sp.]
MSVFSRLKQLNKKFTLSIIWSVVVVSWLVMGGALLIDVRQDLFVTVVVVTAVLTETAFWLTAILLGVAMVDARRAVVQRIKGWVAGRVAS